MIISSPCSISLNNSQKNKHITGQSQRPYEASSHHIIPCTFFEFSILCLRYDLFFSLKPSQNQKIKKLLTFSTLLYNTSSFPFSLHTK